MQKKYIDNYDAIRACIVRVIDDIYDMLDATEQAGISDSRTETLKKVVDRYEALLKKFKNKEDLSGFEEAELNIYCRKLYAAPITEAGFVDQNVCAQNYPQKDFHIMYIGEIIKVEKKDKE